MKTTISVIIPALNEAACIARAIRAAWALGVDEVIVVDGHSLDATPEIARHHGAMVLSSPIGRANQQNVGAMKSRGDVLLFLHADNWLEPDAGQQLRDCLGNPKILGGAFQQHIEAPGHLYRLLEWGNAARVRWRGMAYGDQAIFMRRDTFESLNRFPPVKLMEDVLLMRSFRQLAWPVLLPGPVHVHPRRWQQHGVILQTLRNWTLQLAHAAGFSPDRLAHFYPAHQEVSCHVERVANGQWRGETPEGLSRRR
jgi:rSAM/selenodomain-associated transferase 2